MESWTICSQASGQNFQKNHGLNSGRNPEYQVLGKSTREANLYFQSLQKKSVIASFGFINKFKIATLWKFDPHHTSVSRFKNVGQACIYYSRHIIRHNSKKRNILEIASDIHPAQGFASMNVQEILRKLCRSSKNYH